MQIIGNVATQDDYADALTLEQETADTVSIVVANASALASFRPIARRGGANSPWGPEILFTPQSAPPVKNVSGVRFKSAVPGTPARIIAILTGPEDPQISGGTPFTQILGASGQVVPDKMDDYTVNWVSQSNPQPAIGNGLLAGKFLRVGALVFAEVFFKAGSTTTFGTGIWNFNLPIAPALFGTSIMLGAAGMAWDISASAIYQAAWRSDGYPVTYVNTASGVLQSLIASNAPFVWANTDELQLALLYSAA